MDGVEFRKGDAEVGSTIAKVSSLLLLKILVSSGSVGKQAERKRSIFDVPHLGNGYYPGFTAPEERHTDPIRESYERLSRGKVWFRVIP